METLNELSMQDSFEISGGGRKPESFQQDRKLTRREKRAFKNKLKKPKYQKLAKKIIQSKSK